MAARGKRCLSLLFLVLAIAPRSARSAEGVLTNPEEVGMSAQKLQLVTSALQQIVDEGKVAGAVVIVARRGQTVLFESVGWRDLEKQQPMEQDTLFRIYSMTKPITSVAVMMLAEQGQIDLDAPVEGYLPELADREVFGATPPAARRSITTRDLLRHTSGLTYGFFGNTPVDQQYVQARILAPEGTLADLLTQLKPLPLLAQPGERFNYSVSTDVLGRLVEVVAHETFDKFLSERVFQPLGMTDTAFHVSDAAFPRFANNYGPDDAGKLRVIDAAETSTYRRKPTLLSGGGGLVSTAADYMKFCQMLLGRGTFQGQRLLRPETVSSMTVNQLLGSAYPISVGGDVRHGVGFGLGFSVVVEEIPGAPYVPIGEYGWGGAASTHFWISPADELAVIVLTQYMPFSPQAANAVKPIVYGAIIDR